MPQMQIGTVEQIEAVEPLSLSWVAPCNIKTLPQCSGVYLALANDGRVLYVGRALNMRSRWAAHHKHSLLSGNCARIAWLEVGGDDLDVVEAVLIRRFNPPLNYRKTSRTSGRSSSDNNLSLITIKITPLTLKLIRRIVAKTGEKQYRAWERLVEAEYERTQPKNGNRK